MKATTTGSATMKTTDTITLLDRGSRELPPYTVGDRVESIGGPATITRLYHSGGRIDAEITTDDGRIMSGFPWRGTFGLGITRPA